MKLIGEKIYLKPFGNEHAAKFFEWTRDPEIIKYTSFKPAETIEEQEEINNNRDPKKDIIFAIFLKENDKLIGSVGVHKLDNPDKNFGVGLFIGDKSEWGKGYGTDVFKTWIKYLFEKKGAKKLNLNVYKDNIAAQKVYEKAGFKMKGTKKVLNAKTGKMQEEFYMEFIP